MGPGTDPPPFGDPYLLDELAANAWPALVMQVVDGWRLRVTPGVRARRSNSVLPLAGRDEIPLADRIALVDKFYARWDATVRYQVSAAAQPPELDAVLAERGFGVEAPVHVQAAVLDEVLDRTAAAGPAPARVSEQLEDRWLATTGALFQRSDPGTMRARVLERIGPPVGFALLEIDGQPASVGMGVLERGWVGIFSMGTRPQFRGRGAATAILNALAHWARARGAHHAYLQVEETNHPAHRVYQRAGFRASYRYHYRAHPER